LIWCFCLQLIELRRNPQGSMETRLRGTLKPQAKGTRRDSTTSEMEEKIKDAKSLNQRFRKTLRDKDSELQVRTKNNKYSLLPKCALIFKKNNIV